MGTSIEDLRAFPKSVRKEFGIDLFLLQLGEQPRSWKPMKTIGASVREIRVRENRQQYRTIYVVKKAAGIYVLHAFEKKGQKTSQEDVNLAKKRFKEI